MERTSISTPAPRGDARDYAAGIFARWLLVEKGPALFGFSLAGFLLASLLGFQPGDPTLSNLLTPQGGIANPMGLPGALLGGTALEALGASSLLLPLLVINWFGAPTHRPGAGAFLCWAVVLPLALSMLYALAGAGTGPGLNSAGLAGWAGARWMDATTGRIPGALLAGFAALHSLDRLLYAAPFRFIRTEGQALLKVAAILIAGYAARSRRDMSLGLGRLGAALIGMAGRKGRMIGSVLAVLAFASVHPLRAARAWGEFRQATAPQREEQRVARRTRRQQRRQALKAFLQKAGLSKGSPPATGKPRPPSMLSVSAQAGKREHTPQEGPADQAPGTAGAARPSGGRLNEWLEPLHGAEKDEPAGAETRAGPEKAQISSTGDQDADDGMLSEAARDIAREVGGDTMGDQPDGVVADGLEDRPENSDGASPADPVENSAGETDPETREDDLAKSRAEEEQRWRERFQRYASESRLDFQNCPWREGPGNWEDEAGEEGEPKPLAGVK
ncbi:MAG: DNA translocase FtsK 4TM domain-containing protein [Deltaproteobacteria bacterium]|nr:DNA translocase FtsK 4TM domain-containing protein [Deltaproteobacteria bacterium]